MRINIEASAEELAEIEASGISIGDLPEAIIDSLDYDLSLPGYKVTVNEPSAIQAQLVEALQSCIYLGMQPKKRDKILAALAAAGERP